MDNKIYQDILKRQSLTQTEGASYLYYKPRKRLYYIRPKSVSVKQDDGSWKDFVSYCDIVTGKDYARPPEKFDEDKWEVLSYAETSKRLFELMEI